MLTAAIMSLMLFPTFEIILPGMNGYMDNSLNRRMGVAAAESPGCPVTRIGFIPSADS
jgi:hypothetical protein